LCPHGSVALRNDIHAAASADILDVHGIAPSAPEVSGKACRALIGTVNPEGDAGFCPCLGLDGDP
jgi:hypothetical protein